MDLHSCCQGHCVLRGRLFMNARSTGQRPHSPTTHDYFRCISYMLQHTTSSCLRSPRTARMCRSYRLWPHAATVCPCKCPPLRATWCHACRFKRDMTRHYELGKLIGAGTFGTVYEAKCRKCVHPSRLLESISDCETYDRQSTSILVYHMKLLTPRRLMYEDYPSA